MFADQFTLSVLITEVRIPYYTTGRDPNQL